MDNFAWCRASCGSHSYYEPSVTQAKRQCREVARSPESDPKEGARIVFV